MIKAVRLQAGDTIGVIAPASPTADERREGARQALEALGFEVHMGESCFNKWGYLAGSDELRAADVNGMFADPAIQGIICLRGGYGTLRLLDKLDYELIRDNPKVFVGYSDITALHIAINQRSELATFHGPMGASEMAEGMDVFSEASLVKAVTSPEPMGEIINPDGEGAPCCLVPGEATGRLIGGNLAVLTSTLGTAYEIDTTGKILFLEDIDEKPYRIDRMLTQLYLAGKLQAASGIILGDWNNCEADPADSLTLEDVLHDILGRAGRPTVFNLRSGHCKPMLTLPLGVEVSINAALGQIVINEGGVR